MRNTWTVLEFQRRVLELWLVPGLATTCGRGRPRYGSKRPSWATSIGWSQWKWLYIPGGSIVSMTSQFYPQVAFHVFFNQMSLDNCMRGLLVDILEKRGRLHTRLYWFRTREDVALWCRIPKVGTWVRTPDLHQLCCLRQTLENAAGPNGNSKSWSTLDVWTGSNSGGLRVGVSLWRTAHTTPFRPPSDGEVGS